jgi:hypothetical protein
MPIPPREALTKLTKGSPRPKLGGFCQFWRFLRELCVLRAGSQSSGSDDGQRRALDKLILNLDNSVSET